MKKIVYTKDTGAFMGCLNGATSLILGFIVLIFFAANNWLLLKGLIIMLLILGVIMWIGLTLSSSQSNTSISYYETETNSNRKSNVTEIIEINPEIQVLGLNNLTMDIEKIEKVTKGDKFIYCVYYTITNTCNQIIPCINSNINGFAGNRELFSMEYCLMDTSLDEYGSISNDICFNSNQAIEIDKISFNLYFR